MPSRSSNKPADCATRRRSVTPCVFTSARAAYAARDVDTLIDHIFVEGFGVDSGGPAAGHYPTLRNRHQRGRPRSPPLEPSVSELRIGEILASDTIIEGVLNASDATVVRTALAAAQRLSTPTLSGDDETLEDGVTPPTARTDPRTPAQQRADALLADGTLHSDEYRRLSARLRERIEGTEAAPRRSTARVEHVSDFAGQGSNVRQAWPEWTVEERRNVISAVAEKFIIAPGSGGHFKPNRVKPVWRF